MQNEHKIRFLQNEITSLRETVRSLIAEKNTLKIDNQYLASVNDLLNERILNMTEEYTDAVNEYRRKTRELEKIRNDYEKQITDFKMSAKKYKDEISAMINSIGSK